MAENQLVALEAFLKDHPTIGFTPPSHPEFASLCKICNASYRDVPLAIVHPHSPEDVSTLIKYVQSTGLKFTIRTGGHNMEGRAIVEEALVIDMRALTSVQVAADRQSATVQGGILQGDLGKKLWQEGVVTPTGSIPSVGYVGWAMYGGYGAFSSRWGLGVDQILGATVVNPDGEIVKADEALLKGIRGAGGVFGVIVDMTIKVYPVKSLLAGIIMYDSQDISKTMAEFNAGYQKLLKEGIPSQLTLQQLAFNAPPGRIFGATMVWSDDDLEEGQRWIQKIANLSTPIMNTVAPTTIPEWFDGNAALVPETMYGTTRTLNLYEITPEIAAIFGRYVQQMPSNPGAMFSMHGLRGPSAFPRDNSVFGTREPHFLIEILGFSTEEESAKESQQWAARFVDEIRKEASGNILPTAYISIYHTKDEPKPLKDFYGLHAEEVEALKEKFDPENVFSLSFPQVK
ncbi:D-lactate dehydrogenase [Aspergillus steynii IBT 23096]|uniref:D-lactate dehydrogenase n=1 Tax=Aspergillus steynii IBT 23096 TaxID=1392250 RepID=A0A2I2GHE1_9EURO|nr:D-lactate dehydrogenase [Aspergillus steynii IBT 23096]PLB52299.1 D-lactate dehydrogenase [Aspergillus steynii IBT 23096]